MDRGKATSLKRLDFSVAFDTVDHTILLHRLDSLEHWFGITGIAWNGLSHISNTALNLCLFMSSSLTRQTLVTVCSRALSWVHSFLLSTQYTYFLALFLLNTVLDTTFMPMILKSSSTSTRLQGWLIINYSVIHLKLNFCCWKRLRNLKI